MYKIALTGGIGTGKTFLSKNFIDMGIPVFYADDEAKTLYQDETFLQKLTALFGSEILADGRVHLRKLSNLVFNDQTQLEKLNRLVHPCVMELFEKWAAQQDSNTVMMESAIIFEGHLESYFDKIIVADAPFELRLQRVQFRNPELTREDILQRMSHQMPQEEKCRRADLVVCTGETYAASQNIKNEELGIQKQ
ncbi:MAG: dephospho-CoA kinase [Bacteroidales bacterium]|nr:dephospho-CoA kinase [Bacteroidales bacterium]